MAGETLARLQVNMVATRRLSEREDEPILHQIKKTQIEHKCFLKSVSKEDEPNIVEIAAATATHIARVSRRTSAGPGVP